VRGGPKLRAVDGAAPHPHPLPTAKNNGEREKVDVLVDLDGTLVDPKPGLIGSFQYALRRLGAPVPPADELTWVIGPPLRTSFPKVLGDAMRTEEALAHYRNGAMFDAIVYDGIVDALDRLSMAGCRLIVATSKPHAFARPILERLGLARHFAAAHGPELDGTNDHKADLLAHIIAREGIDPTRAVMIGDREFDVIAAARNGMPAVGVTWGYGSAEELRSAGAAALCDRPADLPTAVLAQALAPSRSAGSGVR
jgi:phosphoglycolate phosphatase